MKIAIITGSRNWTDAAVIHKALEEFKPDLVVQGLAKGADTIARCWAIDNGVEYEDWPANWHIHGKAAGPIRNQHMLGRYADNGYVAEQVLVLAFRLGGESSRGTTHAIKLAKKMGLAVKVTDVLNWQEQIIPLPGFTTGEE